MMSTILPSLEVSSTPYGNAGAARHSPHAIQNTSFNSSPKPKPKSMRLVHKPLAMVTILTVFGSPFCDGKSHIVIHVVPFRTSPCQYWYIHSLHADSDRLVPSPACSRSRHKICEEKSVLMSRLCLPCFSYSIQLTWLDLCVMSSPTWEWSTYHMGNLQHVLNCK